MNLKRKITDMQTSVSELAVKLRDIISRTPSTEGSVLYLRAARAALDTADAHLGLAYGSVTELSPMEKFKTFVTDPDELKVLDAVEEYYRGSGTTYSPGQIARYAKITMQRSVALLDKIAVRQNLGGPIRQQWQWLDEDDDGNSETYLITAEEAQQITKDDGLTHPDTGDWINPMVQYSFMSNDSFFE